LKGRLRHAYTYFESVKIDIKMKITLKFVIVAIELKLTLKIVKQIEVRGRSFVSSPTANMSMPQFVECWRIWKFRIFLFFRITFFIWNFQTTNDWISWKYICQMFHRVWRNHKILKKKLKSNNSKCVLLIRIRTVVLHSVNLN
jgi:hypothetical protein